MTPMEAVTIKIDAEEFDKAVTTGLPEGLDITFLIKEKATNEGNPAVCITWSVQLPNGNIDRVQAVTTLRALRRVLQFISARYEDK